MKTKNQLENELENLFEITTYLDLAIGYCGAEEQLEMDLSVLLEQVRNKILILENHLDTI